LDAKIELQAVLEMANQAGVASISVSGTASHIHWHIEGDTVVFQLSPELCYYLDIPTSSVQ